MGFNTTILILNDRLGEIEKDAEYFVKEMCLQAGGGGNMGPAPLDFHHSQSSIIETHHANQTAVILVGGNTATVIGFARGYRHTELTARSASSKRCSPSTATASAASL